MRPWLLPDAVYNGTDGGANRLYRNTGNFAFVDVTEQTGMAVDADRLSLAASWEDFDDDGDTDLYVANDFGPNSLYRNDGGKFAQIAAAAGADDPSTGMSITWGDVDRDGRMDACIGNMFSAAGNRVTMQPKFGEDLTQGLELDRVRYLARGNTLLMNQGSESFDERSEQAGVVNTQWTWATLMADLDNSGSLDMLAMNGYVTGPTPTICEASTGGRSCRNQEPRADLASSWRSICAKGGRSAAANAMSCFSIPPTQSAASPTCLRSRASMPRVMAVGSG